MRSMPLHRILTAARARFPLRRRRAFTKPSSLGWKVARMISTNSLAAFTQEVTRSRPGGAPSPIPPQARLGRPEVEAVAQRKLEAVPPLPARPPPRGSLLDLKV